MFLESWLYHLFAAGIGVHLTQGVRHLWALAIAQLVNSHPIRSRFVKLMRNILLFSYRAHFV